MFFKDKNSLFNLSLYPYQKWHIIICENVFNKKINYMWYLFLQIISGLCRHNYILESQKPSWTWHLSCWLPWMWNAIPYSCKNVNRWLHLEKEVVSWLSASNCLNVMCVGHVQNAGFSNSDAEINPSTAVLCNGLRGSSWNNRTKEILENTHEL